MAKPDVTEISPAPRSRRLATLVIRDRLMVDLLRCTSSPAATPEGLLQFVHTADLPKDLKIVFAQWDFADGSIVLVCESASFAEVTESGTVTALPTLLPKYCRYATSLKDLAQRFGSRTRGDEARDEALNFALDIIRNYEADIRDSRERLGIDLVARGFCQGSVYKSAVTRIELALTAAGPFSVWPPANEESDPVHAAGSGI